MCKHVLTCAQIKPEEVDIFLKGGGALDINSVKKKPKVRRSSKSYTLPPVLQNHNSFILCTVECPKSRPCAHALFTAVKPLYWFDLPGSTPSLFASGHLGGLCRCIETNLSSIFP